MTKAIFYSKCIFLEVSEKIISIYNNIDNLFFYTRCRQDCRGFSMSQKIPTGEFKSGKSNDINKDVLKTMLKMVNLAILESIDLKYLKKFVWSQNELPFFPETRVVNEALNHGLKLTKVRQTIKFN